MKRRDFLKSAGCFVASASMSGLLGCSSDAKHRAAAGLYAFPQGVASGDPEPTSVMLWTRVVPTDKSTEPIELTLEVSQSQTFDKLVLSKTVMASDASDFTVRVLVEQLSADSAYYYRFRAGADGSRVGRTRTAPKADADVPVRFAWVSCQDYSANYYSAYRQMLNDDSAAPEAEQLHFVMHVGDFIYETRGAGFQQPVDDALQPVTLVDAAGKLRQVPPFPSGGGKAKDGTNFAQTVDDYRHLYKNYLLDADLQDARARWPFICMWDDHEFTDDCWQTQANYDRASSTDEPSQKRRVAASQAWFEYVPAVLSEAVAVDGVKSEAKDFEPVQVQDVKYTDFVDVTEPNNLKAISAISVHRNLRWGKHVDLVLSDNRSYRSDHAIPEDVTANSLLIFQPRNALPMDAVNVMDAGKTANAGNPPDKVQGLDNLRKDSPPGTMLGDAQKKWWKAVMQASDATFKVWGNSVPLLRLLLDTTDQKLIPNDLVMSDDAWDGYNTERKELMKFLLDSGIANVVSLSGDHHANYAGVIYDDFDAPSPRPVMVDLCAAAISSNSQFSSVASAFSSAIPAAIASAADQVTRLITYDATKLGGTDKAVVNLNTLIRYGSHAANVAADTNDAAKAEAARNPKINPHLRYADARATGYGLASVTAQALTATLVTIERNYKPVGDKSPGVRGSATFQIQRVGKPEDVTMPEPTLTGKKPFPLV
jgi:alkaline phosphatase D